jgi:hypothetical protein
MMGPRFSKKIIEEEMKAFYNPSDIYNKNINKIIESS